MGNDLFSKVPKANSALALCMIVHHGDGVQPGRF